MLNMTRTLLTASLTPHLLACPCFTKPVLWGKPKAEGQGAKDLPADLLTLPFLSLPNFPTPHPISARVLPRFHFPLVKIVSSFHSILFWQWSEPSPFLRAIVVGKVENPIMIKEAIQNSSYMLPVVMNLVPIFFLLPPGRNKHREI